VFKKDLYMKVVFTIIALSLCVIAIRNTELIKKAEANSGQNIHITNAEEIGRAIATSFDDTSISDYITQIAYEISIRD